ncbi:O-succinylhomoserine sulfhydrylase [Pelagibacterium flavum]|uniref:O-succinylhomoserine sulfhydrylase n=1 Tax=Pelagibacterium flavum TaxID=2984530 RepID=A0ABY6IM41_9HYPH|nr:O-succinylhomoserine sulfhydrylase [Pelagibacterium sp. YIM 151497]MAN76211.1 O-succinylhomoserine sulfhydrylase [Hyphomicrobiales bacterium]UYQ71661.1 O-succinylhomoserine sulfhydrylase [Pelagibacterium sp. YIM 151497]|tara:strand:+ start:144 stop:1352 length:1209 start_codon:yes stop_codon:yes gene_type:complete
MSDRTSNPLFDHKHRKAQTMMVHGGMERSQHGETSEAIFFNSGFVYPTSGSAEARFKGEEPGHIYSRFSNPTVEMFQQRAALLEGAEAARATATGMAAVTTAVMSQLRAGDHVVAARALFGGCRFVVETYMPRWGVESTLVDGRDPENFARAMRPNTKVVFIETPTNPTLELVDIKAVAEIAHAHNAVLIVDNVFATPIWQKPLELGADLVTYSATKHIDGQGRAMGGLILGSKELIEADVHTIIRQTGPSISPFNAWVLLKGLETLSLRVKAMTENAAKIADFLAGHPKIESISYPFHPSHPQYELAKRQMGGGSTLVALTPKGGKQAAFALADALAIIAISNNLGDAKSIISHPATTTHQRFTPEEKVEMDITEGLLRLSVGLEDADDLIADLSFGLDQV